MNRDGQRSVPRGRDRYACLLMAPLVQFWAGCWERRSRYRPWLGAVATFIASNIIYWQAARNAGFSYQIVNTHVKWDSFNYLAIASDGYEKHLCGEADWPRRPGTWWCGTVAWYPLYPAAIRVVHEVTRLDPAVSGWLIAEAAAIAMLVLLAVMLYRLQPGGHELAVLAVAATLPAGIYFNAVFPMSLTALLLMLGAVLLARQRWLWSGIAFGLAAAAYQLGVLGGVMAAGVIGWLVWRRELSWRRGLLAMVAAGGPTVAGSLSVLVIMHFAVGHWNAPLMLEATSAGLRRSHNVLSNFSFLATNGYGAVRAEFLLATALVLLILVAVALAHAAGRLQPLDVGLGLFSIAMYVAPLVVGVQISQFRAHLLLVPALLLLRHLPVWVPWVLACASLPASYALSQLIVKNLVV